MMIGMMMMIRIVIGSTVVLVVYFIISRLIFCFRVSDVTLSGTWVISVFV